MRPASRQRRAGFALLPVVLALALLGATAYLMTRESALGGSLASATQQQQRARYLAEAAVRHADWQVQGASCSGFSDVATTSFAGGSYDATVTPVSGSPVTLSATGTLADGTTHTIDRSGLAAYETPTTLVLELGTDPGRDTIIEDFYQRNFGGANYLEVSADPGWIEHVLLDFDVSGIPTQVKILSAKLQLRMWSVASAGSATVHRVTRDWVEGTQNGGGQADGATWQTHDGTNAWSDPGGDFAAAPLAETSIQPGDTWVTWEIAPLVQQWVDGALNHGLLLAGAAGLDEAEFASADTNNPPDRPKLEITYACECGEVCVAQGSALWLTTLSDVTSSGAPGLDAWGEGDVLAFADPNLDLEPGVTDGTFSIALNLDGFASDDSCLIDAVHQVASNVTVGGANSVDLVPGDVLVSIRDPETLTSTNSLSVNPEDVFVFRPDTPGDYGSGTFIFLIDGSQLHGENTVGISLVEKDTSVGDGFLARGSFLMAITNRRDVIEFTADDVGLGTTSGGFNEFIDGPTLSFGSEIRGLDLAEEALAIGGHAVPSGSILLTLNKDDTDGVGDNRIPANTQDVFYLTVTQTGASPVAEATLLFEGGDVGLDAPEEEVQALAMASSAGGSAQTVLLVVGDATTPLADSRDAGRKALLESWGFSVALIDDGESQASFDAEAAAADVVYVTASVGGGTLADKLTGSPTPIVSEFPGKLDNFGFSSGTTQTLQADTFSKSDAAHYVTSPFGGAAIGVFSLSLTMPVPAGTLAPDLQALAGLSSFGTGTLPGLAALASGAQRWDGNPAPARRVHLPFGAAETSQLTADGETLMRRSIEWGAGAGDGGGGGGGGEPVDPPTGGVVFEGFAEVDPSTTYNVDVPTPSGTLGGDLLIAAIASDEDAIDLTAPAGWNLIALQAATTRVTLGVWWKIAGASEPATHHFTSSRYEMKYGWMMRFSGHDPANPIHATSSFDTGSSRDPTVPSTTTTVANTLVLRIGGFDHQDIIVDDPGLAGHTPITMDLGGSGLGACAGGAGYTYLSAAGSTGTTDFALTAKEEYVTGTIAIAPDPN